MASYKKVPSKRARKGYTWQARISYEDELGKTRYETKSGFSTKKEATEWAVQTEYDRMHGKKKLGNMTLDELWKQYNELELSMKRANTIVSYEQTYRLYIQPYLGEAKIARLNYHNLQKYFNERSDLSKGIGQIIRKVLNGLFKFAMKQGLLNDNPLKNVTSSFQRPEKKENYLTEKDLEVMVGVMLLKEDYRDYSAAIAVYLGYYLGLRISEALGLRWQDVDFENDIVHIRTQVSFNGKFVKKNVCLTDKLKSKTSKADLPLPQPLKEILQKWREFNHFDMVCCDKDGGLIFPRFVQERLKKTNFHFHQLRHTYITNIVHECDPKTAAALSRHSNVDTTLDIYTEVTFDKIVDVMNSVFPADEEDYIDF